VRDARRASDETNLHRCAATASSYAKHREVMKSILPEWYQHDDKTIEMIVKTGTIAFDANALLDLYRVNRGMRAESSLPLTALGRFWCAVSVSPTTLSLLR
jgi:hypothetical protein